MENREIELKQNEILTIEEYLNRRKGNRKKEEQGHTLLTKLEWNVMILGVK